MVTTRIAVLSEDRLFADALADVLRADSTLVVVPHDARESIQISVVDARSGRAPRLLWPASGTVPSLVIFVGAADDEAWALEALALGARGILTHEASREDLAKAIAIVRQGGIWARRRWLNAYVQYGTARISEQITTHWATLGASLSRREEEVFRHAASGAANKDIAHRLGIAESTVKVHLTRIFQKLGVGGRAELAAVYFGLRASPRATVKPLIPVPKRPQ